VKVTIVEAADRLLPGEEPEASEAVATAFEAEGINVVAGAMVERVRADGGSIVVTLAGGEELAGKRLLVATGRTWGLSPSDLEAMVSSRLMSACVQATGSGRWAM